jgi:dihydroneopterin aldolase
MLPWTINVAELQTRSRVGIWDHEREYQPIVVSLSLRAICAASPADIGECLDYQPICRWITDEWPQWPHTPLLETRVRELMQFLFDYDSSVEWVDVALAKPNAIAGSRSAGVRLALSRGDFEAHFAPGRNAIEACRIQANGVALP